MREMTPEELQRIAENPIIGVAAEDSLAVSPDPTRNTPTHQLGQRTKLTPAEQEELFKECWSAPRTPLQVLPSGITIATTDSDIYDMDVMQLVAEIRRLRGAIRHHRNLEGNDRCWMDDQELYAILPEDKNAPGHLVNFQLPPKGEFLGNCANYCAHFWEKRQPPHMKQQTSEGGESTEVVVQATQTLEDSKI